MNDDEDFPEFDQYERIGRLFESGFRSHCLIDYDHPIRKGDKVSKVQRAANPMIPISGVICSSCIHVIPKAKG